MALPSADAVKARADTRENFMVMEVWYFLLRRMTGSYKNR